MRRHLRLSTWLALLVAGIAVPLLAFAGLELWSVLDANERERDAALSSRARAIASAVDAEIRAWRATLATLADASDIRDGEFRAFDDHARIVAARHDGWIVVIDALGQQHLNTLRPAGAALPRTAAPAMVRAVFQDGKPVTDFTYGAVAQRHIISNAVPVVRDGRVVFCLAMNFGPERLTRLLEVQKLPATWVSAIVDRQNLVVARSLDAEKRVGKPAPQALKEAVAGAEAGVTTYTLIDGRQARVAFQRLAEVPWVLVLAVPVSELTSTRPLIGFGGIAVLLSLIAIGTAVVAGRTIAQPIRRLADLAPTLTQGGAAPVDVASRVQEVRQLQQALVEGAERERASARERERTAEALRQAGAYNRSLIEASLDPLVTIGSDGRITDVNRATEAAIGRRRAELIGTDFCDYFTAPEEARAGYQQAFREGLVRDYPLEIRHRDGHITPVLYNAAVYRDEGGHIGGVFAAARDITERKRAEAALKEANETLEQRVAERTEALRESEARLRLQIERMPIACILHDAEFRVSGWNPAAERLFGFAADEALGRNQYDLIIPPSARDAVRGIFSRVAAGDMAAHSVNENITKDGRRLLCEWTNTPILDDQGRLTGLLAMAQDVTERTRIAGELLEAQQRLQAVMDAVPVGVSYSGDATCRHVTGNPAVLAQFEVGVADDLSASALEAGAPGRQVRFYRDGRQIGDAELPLQRAVAENRGIPPLELEVVLPSGRRWFAEGSGAPVRDQHGNVIGGVAVTVDITERKEDEERLRASLREKEVLLKEIHHRVKNNLQVISSLVRLQADALADPTLRDLFGDVHDRVRSMALVHEKLYESANLARVQFADYARSLLGSLWRAHGAAGIRLTPELEPVRLLVETAVPCGLILNELAVNALKHAFTGRTEGEVTVALRSGPDGRVSLRVADDGVGLPPGLAWRESRSLGLQLVQMLAGQLGGTVEVQSGPGTVFVVTFTPPAGDGERPS